MQNGSSANLARTLAASAVDPFALSISDEIEAWIRQQDEAAHALWRGAGALLQEVCGPCRRQREDAERCHDRGRLRHRFGWHRHPSDAGRSAQEAPDRQSGGSGPWPRLDHLQQERHPFRPGKTDGDLRRAPRDARRHHPRLRHRGIQGYRRPDHRGSRRACEARRRRQC